MNLMKKTLICLLTLVSLLSICTLCFGEELAQDRIYLEQMYEVNHIENLQKNHNALVFTLTYPGEEGEEEHTSRGEYIFFDGYIWYESDSESADLTMDSYTCGFQNSPSNGAMYYAFIDGETTYKNMVAYTEKDYVDAVALTWVEPYPGVKETVVNVTEGDGVRKIVTSSVYEDIPDDPWTTVYTVDPITMELQEIYYNFGYENGYMRYTVTYDEPYVPECVAQGIVSNGDEQTGVTIIVNPGLEDEETLNYTVAKDAYVAFNSTNPGAMYLDRELTQEIWSAPLEEDEVTVYASTHVGEW